MGVTVCGKNMWAGYSRRRTNERAKKSNRFLGKEEGDTRARRRRKNLIVF